MKAIILSAGQGRRLLPWTARTPKGLLPVRGAESVLEVQLHALAACGVDEVCVAVGFGADLPRPPRAWLVMHSRSIVVRKPISSKTRIVAITIDSPTCGLE